MNKFLHDRPCISPWIKSISNELRHQKSIATSAAERRPSEWDTVMSCKKYNNVCTLVTNCFCAHSSVIFVFIQSPSLLRNKHKNNLLMGAETVRHSSTYIMLIFRCHLWYEIKFSLACRILGTCNVPQGMWIICSIAENVKICLPLWLWLSRETGYAWGPAICTPPQRRHSRTRLP